MGWSCSKAANDTLKKVDEACRTQSAQIMGKPLGMSNVYTHKGVAYIIETSRKEHDDGAITGSIIRVTSGNPYADGTCYSARAGSFRIDGDGTFARGPAWMRKLTEGR